MVQPQTAKNAQLEGTNTERKREGATDAREVQQRPSKEPSHENNVILFDIRQEMASLVFEGPSFLCCLATSFEILKSVCNIMLIPITYGSHRVRQSYLLNIC